MAICTNLVTQASGSDCNLTAGLDWIDGSKGLHLAPSWDRWTGPTSSSIEKSDSGWDMHVASPRCTPGVCQKKNRHGMSEEKRRVWRISRYTERGSRKLDIGRRKAETRKKRWKKQKEHVVPPTFSLTVIFSLPFIKHVRPLRGPSPNAKTALHAIALLPCSEIPTRPRPCRFSTSKCGKRAKIKKIKKINETERLLPSLPTGRKPPF